MKTRLIIYFMIVLQGCNLINPPIAPEEEEYIYINIANNDLVPATKGFPIAGVDSLKENLLESLYIIMYNKTRQERLRTSDIYVTAGNPNWVGGMVSIAASTLNTYSETDSIIVFVIANTSVAAQRNALQACSTAEDIKSVLDNYEYERHLTLSGTYYQPANAANARPFLMEAHNEVLMNPNRYPFVSLTLSRLAVKIRIKLILDQPEITAGVPDPYFNRWAGEDVTYNLVRASSACRLVNTGNLCNPNERDFISTEYKAFNYNEIDSTDESVLYTLENEWIQNNVNETFLRLSVPFYNNQGVKVDSNYYKIRLNVEEMRRNDFFDILATIKLVGSPIVTEPVVLPQARVAVVQNWDTASIDIYQQSDHIWVSSTRIDMFGASGYFRMSSSRTPTFRAYFLPAAAIPEQDDAIISYTNYVLANRNKIYVNIIDTLERFRDYDTLRIDIQAGILKKSIEFYCYPASYFYMDQDSVIHNHILMTPVAEPPFMLLGPATEEGITSNTESANLAVNYSIQIADTIATCINYDNHAGARFYCSNYIQDGYDDWRVPTMAEMKLVLVARAAALTKNANDPFYKASSFPVNVNYWTAKSAAEGQGTSNNVYAISFPSGTEVVLTTGASAYVRCVRAITEEL